MSTLRTACDRLALAQRQKNFLHRFAREALQPTNPMPFCNLGRLYALQDAELRQCAMVLSSVGAANDGVAAA